MTDRRQESTHAAGLTVTTWGKTWRLAILVAFALAFLFPFYFMVIGSLQQVNKTDSIKLIPRTIGFGNYRSIDSSIDLGQSLLNSGVFTMGVLIGTMIFGLLTGYALAQLKFRGRGVIFALMIVVQTIPIQLVLIPLYVMIVRNYGLGDSYLGMIAPFAINSTAVFIFRQYFLMLPSSLFEAARIDGAGELRILFRVAIPLCKPALITGGILTFLGPWNEFLWPFLVTKRADMQPLAVSLANYLTTVATRADNPLGSVMAGSFILAIPAIVLFIVFQRKFISAQLDSATKG